MSATRSNSPVISGTRAVLVVVSCTVVQCLLLNVRLAQGTGERRINPRVTLLTPKGFTVSIDDARDLRQLHIFWNLRKPYNRTRPYSTTDFANVTSNEDRASSLSVGDSQVELRAGDTVFYWLLVTTVDWLRVTLHKRNFWVKPDGTAVPVAETYYRDYTQYCTDDEL